MKRALAVSVMLIAIAAACVDQSGLSTAPVGDAATVVGDAMGMDVAAPATGDGGSDSGSDSAPLDAGPPWLLYAYFEERSPPAWGAAVAVDQFFGGSANAPSPRGISSISLASSIDRLFVFTLDGQLYIRAGASWLPPKPANAVFSTLGSSVPRAGYSLPLRDGGSSSISYTASAPPSAFIFTYANDQAIPTGTPIPLTDDDAGAPQASRPVDWDFEVYDVSRTDASWAQLYMGFGDDIYRLDAAAVWTHWTSATFPYFAGKAGAPPVNRIRAAFYDSTLRILYTVCEPG